ncbi:SMI1/KNR4 family protein [Hafnia alvei]|uniref:SMI1/KNR4 family protein n=1 Tax=Hafnia alvei TaxID=569 RepID=UPI0014121C07|nr:SMI1/KNR4 family protein [Hafnia alvei]QIP55966.1 hypothetical protein HBA19_10270 [Hafnia alvei]
MSNYIRIGAQKVQHKDGYCVFSDGREFWGYHDDSYDFKIYREHVKISDSEYGVCIYTSQVYDVNGKEVNVSKKIKNKIISRVVSGAKLLTNFTIILIGDDDKEINTSKHQLMHINTESFNQLSPYPKLGEKVKDSVNLNDFDSYIPKEYLNLLNNYDGGVFFHSGAKVKIKTEIPFISDGFIHVLFLYGCTDDDYGLKYIISHLPSDIHTDYIPIAECDGGDYICLKKDTKEIYYWWHEGLYESDCFYKIEDNIYMFINALEPEETEETEEQEDPFSHEEDFNKLSAWFKKNKKQ